jgi:hypothetical protein
MHVLANFNGIFIGPGEFFQFSARDDALSKNTCLQKSYWGSPITHTSPWSTLFFSGHTQKTRDSLILMLI